MIVSKLMIYINKSFLYIYFNRLLQPIKIELDQFILTNEHDINQDLILQKLKPILQKYNFKNSKAILILGSDFVFDKLLEQESPIDKTNEVNEFVSKILFPKDQIVLKEYVREENTLITATNKFFFTKIINVFLHFKIKILYVLPDVVFNKIEYNKKFISQLFEQKELLDYGSFLEPSNLNKINKILKLIYFLTLLSISIFVIYFVLKQPNSSNLFKNLNNLNVLNDTLINLNKNDNQKKDDLVNTTKNNVSNDQSKSTEQEDELIENDKDKSLNQVDKVLIDKSKIKISVLNGSGVPGFALEVQNLLNLEGFNNTSIANASRFDYTNTIISTTPEIDDQTIDMITKLLNSQLKSFEVNKTLKGENNIQIITGQVRPLN